MLGIFLRWTILTPTLELKDRSILTRAYKKSLLPVHDDRHENDDIRMFFSRNGTLLRKLQEDDEDKKNHEKDEEEHKEDKKKHDKEHNEEDEEHDENDLLSKSNTEEHDEDEEHGVGNHTEHVGGNGVSATHDQHHEQTAIVAQNADAFGPIMFVTLMLVCAAVAMLLDRYLPWFLKPPHTVTLFFMGFLLGFIGQSLGKTNNRFGAFIISYQNLDFHIIFWVLLPPLLFEDASGANWHVLKRIFPNALLLAVPGVMINTGLTAGLVHLTFAQEDQFRFFSIVLMSAILSATDPVAVISALNSLGAPLKLSTLIAGEALMNDGSAIVLFKIFHHIAELGDEGKFDISSALKQFARLGLGGVAFGSALSIVLHYILRLTHKLFYVQVLFIFATIYTAFYCAEQEELNVSAVLSVVVIGYYMSYRGNGLIHPKRHHDYHAILGFLALLANESIFVIAGLVCEKFSTKHGLTEGDDGFDPTQARNIAEVGILYIIIHITRSVTIFVLYPLIRKLGYGLSWKEAIIAVVGGLRGAVGLGLALEVDLAHHITNNGVKKEFHRIAYHVSWITILTLVINGTAVPFFYNTLNIYPQAKHKELLYERAVAQGDVEGNMKRHRWESNWFFHNSFIHLLQHAVPEASELVDKLEDGGAFTEEEKWALRRLTTDEYVMEVLLLAQDGVTENLEKRFESKITHVGGEDNPYDTGNSVVREISADKVDHITSDVIINTLKISKRPFERSVLDHSYLEVDRVQLRMPAFRPGRQAHQVCWKSLPNMLAPRTGDPEQKELLRELYYYNPPHFGVNYLNNEVELRKDKYICCHCSYYVQCKHCAAFQYALANGDLPWGPLSMTIRQRARSRLRWSILRKSLLKVVDIKMGLDAHYGFNNSSMNATLNKGGEFMAYEVNRCFRSVGEVYQSILNTLEHGSEHYFEIGLMNRGTFRMFHKAIEFAEEAIHGEFKTKKILKGTHLEGLTDMEPDDQMHYALDVFWHALEYEMDSQNMSINKRLLRMIKGTTNKEQQEFRFLMRKIEIALVVLFILNVAVSPTRVSHLQLNQFPTIAAKVQSIIRDVKTRFLWDLYKKHTGVFLVVEHLLALRLACVDKVLTFGEMKFQNHIPEDVYSSAVNAIKPTINSIEKYKASPEIFDMIRAFDGRKCANMELYRPAKLNYSSVLTASENGTIIHRLDGPGSPKSMRTAKKDGSQESLNYQNQQGSFNIQYP